MNDKDRWIREIAQEINGRINSIETAIKDTKVEIDSKYDILLCYAKWCVLKLKDVQKQEASYKKQIKYLEQLIYELKNVTEKMKVKFDEQMERKDSLIDTQNEIIADRERTIAKQARIISEMEALYRQLPRAGGE